MESIRERAAAVTPPSSAYARGWLLGRFVLAAGLLLGALIVLGLLLSLAAHAGSTAKGAPAEQAPSAQEAALADFRRAGLPNLDDCRIALSALHDDASTAATNYAAGIPESGALPTDAQQVSTACRVAADQVAQMDVSDPGALDAREALRRWLLDVVAAGDSAKAATDDVAGGQYQEAITLLRAATSAFDAGAKEQDIVGQDLGLALG